MKVLQGDCVRIMSKMKSEKYDTIFADPPFNIGYEYDQYDDRKSQKEYRQWTDRWITQCVRLLKPYGSLFVAIGDEQAAMIKTVLDKKGIYCRNWIIWHYTFGVNCKKKFTRSHAHIFYYTKHPRKFTFNANAIRVKSARQEIGDKRANPNGKIPDDVWTFSRVCGTFKERTKHPCQMPESVLHRILSVSTNPGERVFDPFAGSGTTLKVALDLGMRATGIELSKEYVRQIKRRIANASSSRM